MRAADLAESILRGYAAIVCTWEATLAPDRGGGARTRRAVERLCELGTDVFVLSDADLATVDGRLQARPAGPGRLYVCASRGREVFHVDARGPQLIQRHRLTSDPTNQAHSVQWIWRHLAERGIGSGLVLTAGEAFGSIDGSGPDAVLRPERGERATVVSVGPEPYGVPSGITHCPGGPATFLAILSGVSRYLASRVPDIDEDPDWVLRLPVDPNRREVDEALGTLSDGRFGTRAVLENGGPRPQPAVICGDVYDGTNSSQHLLAAPVWTDLRLLDSDTQVNDEILLDLRTGVLTRRRVCRDDEFRSARFASLAHPGLVAMRAEGAHLGSAPPLRLPGGRNAQRGRSGTATWARVPGSPAGGIAVAASRRRRSLDGRAVLERRAAYLSDPSQVPNAVDACDRLDQAAAEPFAALIGEQRASWARRWADAQIDIPDDAEVQFGARFAVFHLLASVAGSGEAGVGARGLTGSGYAGHVFWDADVFVMPALAAIHPTSARAMLEYRLRRLPAARENAATVGRQGARFPWESARDGHDVTPRLGNVGGMPQPIRTGDCAEHIVADVAWAADHYAQWSGDPSFLGGAGAALIIDTARYWASRVLLDDGRAHINGVVGPDEYHGPVDDNAYTNVMAAWNLNRAADLAATTTLGITKRECQAWRLIADALVDGYDPLTGRYEQFAGYFGLEPLLVSTIGTPPFAADLLLGPDRTARSQVIKQPDVLMLHHLVPTAVAPDSLTANLDYYGPRTSHGSSLSPAIHAALLARAGRADEALTWLRLAARLDLDDLTGTTAAGLHMATLGGVWQALAFGFAGLRAEGDRLRIDPRLPSAWSSMTLRMIFRGSRVRVSLRHGEAVIEADKPVLVAGSGGETLTGTSFRLATP